MLSSSEMTLVQPRAAHFDTFGICIVVMLILLSLRRRLSREYVCL